jgi:unsaturated rhamnogalacturonyl hydrolase
MPKPAAILAQTRRVADWQLAHREALGQDARGAAERAQVRDWQQATFWVALTELADRRCALPRTAARPWPRREWQLGKLAFHADDQLIAQAWEWAARNGGGAEALAPARDYFDNVFANRRRTASSSSPPRRARRRSLCTDRWCWCDALFMAPPTMLRMARPPATSAMPNSRTRNGRRPPTISSTRAKHLYFRDSRFFDQRDAKGRKLFWSRGNGWVMGGLVRVLQVLGQGRPEAPLL